MRMSVRWAQSSFCWFSHEAAQINARIRSSDLPDNSYVLTNKSKVSRCYAGNCSEIRIS